MCSLEASFQSAVAGVAVERVWKWCASILKLLSSFVKFPETVSLVPAPTVSTSVLWFGLRNYVGNFRSTLTTSSTLRREVCAVCASSLRDCHF